MSTPKLVDNLQNRLLDYKSQSELSNTEEAKVPKGEFDADKHPLCPSCGAKHEVQTDVEESEESRLYQPLPAKTIRLLRLHSSKCEDDPISCCLYRINIDEMGGNFDALSYTWGDPYGPVKETHQEGYTANRDREIICNGITVLITRNLLDFLTTARKHGHFSSDAKPLWVDSVCINQEDLDEKAHQVRFMTSIYRCAQEVVVWVGKPDTDIKEAENLIWALKKHDIQDLHDMQPKRIEDLGHNNMFLKGVADKKESWIALGNLLMRTWFSRIWVIQEVGLGGKAKLYFGDLTIKYKYLDHFAECYQHSWWVEKYFLRIFSYKDPHMIYSEAIQTQLVHNISALGHLEQTRTLMELGCPYNYFNIIMISKCFDSTDPRDKIFAILGLLSNIDSFGLPDYRLDPVELYTKIFSMTVAEEGTTVFALIDPREPSSKVQNLPSWCPDYSVKNTYTSDYTATYAPGNSAGNRWKDAMNIGLLEDRSQFRVRIVPIDNISMVGESMTEFLMTGNCPGWISILSSMPNIYEKTGDNKIDVFWRQWVRNREMREHNARPIVGECFARWLIVRIARAIHYAVDEKVGLSIKESAMKSFTELSQLDTTGILPTPDELERYLSPSDTDDESVLTPKTTRKQPEGLGMEAYFHYEDQTPRVKDRMFFCKDEGYLGIGPYTLEKGDMMCLFCGAPCPFIIRKHSDNDGCYELVGPAYVHGLMSEDEVRPLNLGTTWVTLR
jgi:hypothetical protein